MLVLVETRADQGRVAHKRTVLYSAVGGPRLLLMMMIVDKKIWKTRQLKMNDDNQSGKRFIGFDKHTPLGLLRLKEKCLIKNLK